MSVPKVLKVFLRFDQHLFAELLRLIFSLIVECYSTSAGKPISPPSSSRLEGGFNFSGQFYYLPIHDTASASLRQVANTFRKWKP